MNIEQAITAFASLLIAILLGFYAMDREIIVSNGTPPVKAQTSEASPSTPDKTMPGQIFDRQALAEYQATLPLFAAAPEEAKQEAVVAFEQLIDRQSLAEYQATLSPGSP
jgi:hypothetical protein